MTLITGAGSGIGRALAVLLAERGHALVLVGRTQQSLEETARLCNAGAPACKTAVITCDIGDTAAARALIDRVIREFGQLDVLVNCAGIAPRMSIEATDDALMTETFRINTFGPAALITQAWSHFAQRRTGCIVNVSTYGTADPFPGFFAYAASKAALDSFTRSCHNEGAALGIRAFCVNPGAVETSMLRGLFSHEQLPASRVMHPRQVAAVIVDCIEGRRDADLGKPIPVLQE